MKIAIQGEAGSFHDEAAHIFFAQQDIELAACRTFADVFMTVESGAAEAGLVAVENSLYGSIRETHDLLLTHQLTIVGEVSLAIHQQLITTGHRALGDITQVFSHPAALDQCREWLRVNVPHAEIIEWYDTAGAVQHVVHHADAPWAAIASEHASALHGGHITVPNINDEAGNVTRFLVLARPGEHVATQPNKASLNLITSHQPGALYQALGVFEHRGANLTKLESRPVRGQPFRYQFFIAVETDPTTLAMITTELTEQKCQVRILGTYRANALKTDV